MTMGRSDYSVGTSTQADESTYASSVPPASNRDSGRDRDRDRAGRDERTTDASTLASSELPRYTHNHKASRAKKANVSGLNRRLRTEFIDVDPADDSVGASLVRGVVGLVGSCLAPRQILVALRLLKAVTVAFLALTAAADIVYVSCVEFVSGGGPNSYLGHRRDTVLRLYGLACAVLALLIELDKFIMKNFRVLKGFLARFGLLFFVSAVTYCHPAQMEIDANYGYNIGIPMSAVVFQMVSSSVLACCSFMYLLFGLLCFDRFTSRAFLSTQDPVAVTAIPSTKYDAPRMG